MTERDARQLADGAVLTADVCIVGAGAAGITMGLELAGSGLQVALLEGGGETFDAASQNLYVGENVGYDYYPLDQTRLRLLGGSTNHWEGYCLPMDRRDFEVDPTPQLPGWPLDEAEVRAHYERAHELCELGPVDYRPERWSQETGTQLLPLDGGTVRNAVIRRSPPTRFGPEYHEQLRLASDVALYLNANVVEVIVDGGRARGVRIAHLDGATQLFQAPVVVLATGGIENPRLLLCSQDERGRQLGNASDLVGRCFMEHPHVMAGYLLVDDEADIRFYAEDLPVGDSYARGILTLSEEARAERGIGNLAALLYPPPHVTPEEVAVLPGISGVRELQRLNGQRGVTPYQLDLIAEQVPQVTSRVRLSDHQRDALGMPRVVLDWQLDPRDERTLRVGTELMAASLGAVGVGRLHSLLHQSRPDLGARGGHHHMGTTRMSEDPAHGVVNEHCQVHGVEGLFVAGSSVFSSSGFANPTLTIVSLALRLAAHLREVA